MFTKLDQKVASYRANKDNKHPAFLERNGLQDIVDEVKEVIVELLPHGAGIDCGHLTIDWVSNL